MAGTQFTVDLVVKAQTAAMDRITRKLEGVDRVTKRAQGSVDRLEQQFRRFRAPTITPRVRTQQAESAIARIRAKIRDLNQTVTVRVRQQGANLRRGAGAGAAAAGLTGALPGPLGGIAAGAGAGLAAGGPVGAAAGAGIAIAGGLIAAQANMARQAAILNGELEKQKIALAGVLGGQEQAAQALQQLDGVTGRFGGTVKDATANYLQLSAAGTSAGLTNEQVMKTFEGLAAANAALGGNAEKLNGIILASSQVFSKGKVAAEELRGQIGERLPGAFSEFAKATGRSTQELDKALQDGAVTIQDFVTFAESLFDKYATDAEKIYKSPANAGERLQQSMTKLSANLGKLLGPMGAAFQEFATQAVNALNSVIQQATRFFAWMAQREANMLRSQSFRSPGMSSIQMAANISRANEIERDIIPSLTAPAPVQTGGVSTPSVPSILTGGGGGGGGGGGRGGRRTRQGPDMVAPSERILQEADRNIGLLAGISEQCANAIRALYKAAGFGLGVTLRPWDPSDERGQPQGPGYAASLFGDEVGRRVPLDQVRAGDLIAYGGTYNNYPADTITHVGAYLGNGQIIHHNSRRGLHRASRDSMRGSELYAIRPYSLMGPGGEAMGDAMADAAQRAQRAQEQLETSERTLKAAQGELKVAEALEPLEQRLLEWRMERVQITERYEDLLKDAAGEEERQNLLNARGLELATSAVNFEKDKLKVLEDQRKEREQGIIEQAQALESYLRPTLDEIDSLQLGRMSPEERTAIERQRFIAGAVNRGGDAGAAGELFDRFKGEQRITEEYEKQKNLLNSIASTLGGSLRSAIDGLIQGTASWRDITSDLLGKMGDLFLNMGFSMLGSSTNNPFLKGMFSGMGGRAGGGPVGAGKAYMVGENGAELFVPGSSGSILSFDDTQAAVAAALGIDAIGAGGEQEAGLNETRSSLSSTVRNMQERTVERDRERIAASMAPGSSSYQVQWVKVGDMEVVTRDQLEAGLRKAEVNGARRGQAAVARSQKNDPGWRRSMA